MPNKTQSVEVLLEESLVFVDSPQTQTVLVCNPNLYYGDVVFQGRHRKDTRREKTFGCGRKLSSSSLIESHKGDWGKDFTAFRFTEDKAVIIFAEYFLFLLKESPIIRCLARQEKFGKTF